MDPITNLKCSSCGEWLVRIDGGPGPELETRFVVCRECAKITVLDAGTDNIEVKPFEGRAKL